MKMNKISKLDELREAEIKAIRDSMNEVYENKLVHEFVINRILAQAIVKLEKATNTELLNLLQ